MVGEVIKDVPGIVFAHHESGHADEFHDRFICPGETEAEFLKGWT